MALILKTQAKFFPIPAAGLIARPVGPGIFNFRVAVPGQNRYIENQFSQCVVNASRDIWCDPIAREAILPHIQKYIPRDLGIIAKNIGRKIDKRVAQSEESYGPGRPVVEESDVIKSIGVFISNLVTTCINISKKTAERFSNSMFTAICHGSGRGWWRPHGAGHPDEGWSHAFRGKGEPDHDGEDPEAVVGNFMANVVALLAMVIISFESP